jgi:hypothetical protein
MSQVQKRVLYLAWLDKSAAELEDVAKRVAEAFCLDARSQQRCWSYSRVRDHSTALVGKRNATSRSGAIAKGSYSY